MLDKNCFEHTYALTVAVHGHGCHVTVQAKLANKYYHHIWLEETKVFVDVSMVVRLLQIELRAQ